MIIWVNGAFGSGKTQVAHELVRRSDRSWLADPEQVGYGLHHLIPPGARDDFRHLPAWRRGVIEALAAADRAPGVDLVVAPQTLLEGEYAEEIFSGLRRSGRVVRPVTLLARPATLRARLRKRNLGVAGREQWAIDQIDTAVKVLPGIEGALVRTDNLTVDQVVEQIALRCQVTLSRPALHRVPGVARRMRVQLAAIRR